MNELLNRITWHALSGPQAQYTAGTDEARRYIRGFPPILGFANAERPDFAAIADHCEPGEQLYTDGWSGVAPAGWLIDAESTMFKMIWDAAIPAVDEAPDAVRLGATDGAQAMELATLTHPGPFGPRAIELGEYLGYFERQRLVAMAGERMCASGLREISAVCTHPDFQGRGLARRLMRKLIHRQMRRNETSFLHVMRDNGKAHRLYERMGFRDYSESVVRVVSRL